MIVMCFIRKHFSLALEMNLSQNGLCNNSLQPGLNYTESSTLDTNKIRQSATNIKIAQHPLGDLILRREWGSNPRWIAPYLFSRQAP